MQCPAELLRKLLQLRFALDEGRCSAHPQDEPDRLPIDAHRQKNAELFATLLPNALPGWKAERPQTTALGAAGFGASTASRAYNNVKGDHVEVQITGDSAMVSQIAAFLNNPAMAGAMGKLVRVGSQRAIQDGEGNVKMIVASKFLISVEGSADSASKLAYAQAIDFARLAKM